MNEKNGPLIRKSVETLLTLVNVINTDKDSANFRLLREYLNSNTDVLNSINTLNTSINYTFNHNLKDFTPNEIQRNYFVVIKHLAAYKTKNPNMFWGRPPLSLAAELGLEAIILDLIENGADVNEISQFKTAIYHATSKGHADIVKILIKSNAAINIKAGSLHPLHEAIRNGNLKIVKLLIAAGAKVKWRQEIVMTTLLYAAQRPESDDTVEIMRMLIENGADLRATDSDGKTALDIATSSGKTRMASLLRIANEKHVAERRRNAIIRFTNVLGRSKSHNKKPPQEGVGSAENSTDYSPDGLIMKRKIQDLVILMDDLHNELYNVMPRDLQENLEDYLNFTKPLAKYEIWSNADYPLIKEQIELDYQTAMKSLKPYYLQATLTAIESNQVSVLKELFENEFKNTPIFILIIDAADKNNLEIVELFLKSSLPFNRADFKIHNRYSALGFAVRNQNAAMVRMLLAAGAEPYVRVAPEYSNFSSTYTKHYHSVLNYAENSDEIHALLQDAVSNPNRHLILNRLYSRPTLYMGLVCGIALGLGLGLGGSLSYNPGVIIGLALMATVVSTVVLSFLVFMQNRMRYGVSSEEYKACSKPLLNGQYSSNKDSKQLGTGDDKITNKLDNFKGQTLSHNY